MLQLRALPVHLYRSTICRWIKETPARYNSSIAAAAAASTSCQLVSGMISTRLACAISRLLNVCGRDFWYTGFELYCSFSYIAVSDRKLHPPSTKMHWVYRLHTVSTVVHSQSAVQWHAIMLYPWHPAQLRADIVSIAYHQNTFADLFQKV